MAIQAQMYPENLGLPLGGGSQDWMMENNNNNNNNNNLFFNGCGLNEFSFNPQQKQQQQQQFLYNQQQQYFLQLQNLQQRNQQFLSSDNNNDNNNSFVFFPPAKNSVYPTTTATTTTASTTTTSSDHVMSMNFSQSLAAQLDKQRQEMDRYISLQNERLRLALQEQRKQQLAVILKKLEAKAMTLLRQKDEEIAKATKRTMELEEFVRKMEVENQGWQRLAAENEAMVISLSNTLEQLKEQACCLTSSNGVEDVESCCDVESRGKTQHDEEDDPEMKMKMKMICRVCNSRNSCVLFLPCRHLCSCKHCETFLEACPVCKSPKMASIEALTS